MTEVALERREDQEPKYAVLKWKDWLVIRDQAITGIVVSSASASESVAVAVDSRVLRDAEVIRKQDYTSGPVFHLYANMIQTFMDMGHPISGDIRDHFHEAAMDADQWQSKKVPD